MSPHTQRAQLLAQQRRYAQAERELGRALSENPDDGYAHALRGYCQAHRKQYADAGESARQGVALSPDSGAVRVMAASVALMRNRLDEAEELATQASALSPYDPQPFVIRASALAQKKKWQPCLDDAERALQIDPEQTTALNLVALANRGLGRDEEYTGDIGRSLRADPEDPYTHANAGWSHLQQGELDEAERHFREALRLEPGLESARIGVLETTKAKFPVYRWFLGLMLRLQMMPPGQQLGLLVGLWIGSRVLATVAEGVPLLQLVVLPLLLGYLAFCVATWFWRPVSNAALLLHPFARLALTREEKVSAAVATLVFCVLGSLVVAAILDESGVSVALLESALPPGLALAFAFQFDHRQPKRIMLGVAAGLTVVCGVVLAVALQGEASLETMPEWLVRLAVGPFAMIRRWGPLGVILGSQVLGSQHWRD